MKLEETGKHVISLLSCEINNNPTYFVGIEAFWVLISKTPYEPTLLIRFWNISISSKIKYIQ